MVGSLCEPGKSIELHRDDWLDASGPSNLVDLWHEPSGIAYTSSFVERSLLPPFPPRETISDQESLSSSSSIVKPTTWPAFTQRDTELLSSSNPLHHRGARFKEALEVCDYVQERVLSPDNRPAFPIPKNQLFRLQNLMHSSGNLCQWLFDDAQRQWTTEVNNLNRTLPPGGSNTNTRDTLSQRRAWVSGYGVRHDIDGMGEQFRAVEIALRVSHPPHPLPDGVLPLSDYSVRDLVFSVCVAAFLMGAESFALAPSSASLPLKEQITRLVLGRDDVTADQFLERVQTGEEDLMERVNNCGDDLGELLVRSGSGALPVVLMNPTQVENLPRLLFRRWGGVVPALCLPSLTGTSLNSRNVVFPTYAIETGLDDNSIKRMHHTTSTVLLTIARIFQTERPNGLAFGPTSDGSPVRPFNMP